MHTSVELSKKHMVNMRISIFYIFAIIVGVFGNFATGKPDGATCTSGLQCDSYCCAKNGFLSTNQCTRLSKEGEPCESHYLNDRYTYCPCEAGLTCKKAVCIDPNE